MCVCVLYIFLKEVLVEGINGMPSTLKPLQRVSLSCMSLSMCPTFTTRLWIIVVGRGDQCESLPIFFAGRVQDFLVHTLAQKERANRDIHKNGTEND